MGANNAMKHNGQGCVWASEWDGAGMKMDEITIKVIDMTMEKH
jgi:hypothetical protein